MLIHSKFLLSLFQRSLKALEYSCSLLSTFRTLNTINIYALRTHGRFSDMRNAIRHFRAFLCPRALIWQKSHLNSLFMELTNSFLCANVPMKRRTGCALKLLRTPCIFGLVSCYCSEASSCSSARQSWSGQEVGLLPQRTPSRRLMTSLGFMPMTRRASPFVLPSHPPWKTHWLMHPSGPVATCMY